VFQNAPGARWHSRNFKHLRGGEELRKGVLKHPLQPGVAQARTLPALAARGGEQAALDEARDPKKSGGLLRERERVKIAFIDAEKAAFLVEVLRGALGVSRGGYSARKVRPADSINRIFFGELRNTA